MRDMRFKRQWNSEYKGVRYEIHHHGVSEYLPCGYWTYYIYIFIDDLDDEHKKLFDLPTVNLRWDEQSKDHISWDCSTVPYLDFHGGITFADMSSYLRRDGSIGRTAKLGCDYSHGMDEPYRHTYDEIILQKDAEATIDEFRKIVPLKVGE